MTNLDTTTVATTENKGQIIKFQLEKLDGGYVSDATGKRSIYRDAEEILDVINMHKMINKLENNQYHCDIIILPKEDYIEREELAELHTNEEITLESAREEGLIERVSFNPLPTMTEPDITAPIRVTAANAYSTTRLKDIDWKGYSTQLEMPIAEMAIIAGVKKESFYATWAAIMKGTCKFQRTETKIGLTILAQYYEKTLGMKVSLKESAEQTKQDMLDGIRKIELMATKKQWIKSSELMKELNAMRNSLLK